MTFDFTKWLTETHAWAAKAFGSGPRITGLVDHMRKEVDEVEKKPGDITEYVDLIFLAVDGARRHVEGYTPELLQRAMADKLAENRARTWPDWRTADPNKAIEHVRIVDTSLAQQQQQFQGTQKRRSA